MKALSPASTATLAATSKTGLAIGQRGDAHRIRALRAELVGGRLRYSARWHCRKQVAPNVTLLPAAHGLAVCAHCEDRLRPCVYRCLAAAGRLVYIGSTIKRTRRMAQHSRSSPWWPLVAEVRYEDFPTYEAAYAAEQAAITSEAPAFNRKPGGVLTAFPELGFDDLFEVVAPEGSAA